MKNPGRPAREGKLMMAAGILLMLAALCFAGYQFWDESRASDSVGQMLQTVEIHREELPADQIPDYLLNPDMEMPTTDVPGGKCIGILEIPALGLQIPVLSVLDDTALKTAPCRYKGSAYLDNLIIGGHNYRSHFGQLYTLHPGDELYFTDVDGNLFPYQLLETEVIDQTAVVELEEGDWDMTLFTCDYGRTKRITLRCGRTDL